MPIQLTCSGCGVSLNRKDELRGKRVKCPKCGHVMPMQVCSTGVGSPQMIPPDKSPAVSSAKSLPTAAQPADVSSEEEQASQLAKLFPKDDPLPALSKPAQAFQLAWWCLSFFIKVTVAIVG